MRGSLNKVMLIGNLGDEVKMHHFDGGGCIGRFSIATNESYTNKTTGEKVSNTEWHNVVVKNKAAEICEKYLKKGDKIYVEGKIKTRKWQSEDGVQRYSTEIHVTEFNFLSSKNDSSSDSNFNSDDDHQNESIKDDNQADNQADDLPF
ncbi:MAG: single-stranded DNA-binding protein [Flavobacteriaceae bacterium]|nr:single-stranded DNA-binding protein [Flavobacteriaceae bacterium]